MINIGNNSKNNYGEIVQGAKENFEKLKKNFSNATIALNETTAFSEKLEVEIDNLRKNLKILEEKANEDGSVKPTDLRALIDAKAETDEFDKVLSDFIIRSKKVETPLDNFETFEQELNSLEDDIKNDVDSKIVGKKMEEIYSYVTKCINFINFYNHYKNKLDNAYKILVDRNKEVNKLISGESWVDCFGKMFNPYVKTITSAVLSASVSFFTNRVLTSMFTA